jgi:hypothetical protein
VLDSCTCINFLNKKIPSLPLGDLFIIKGILTID